MPLPNYLPALFALLLTTGTVLPGAAQTPPPPSTATTANPVFDVASIRESKIEPGGSFMVGGGFEGGLFRVTNFNLHNLLGMAYGADWHQQQGLPAWAERPMYNIEARTDEATAAKLVALPKEQRNLLQQQLVQGLLADRFHLQAHWETRPGNIYRLVVAKGGPRLHPGGSVPPTPQELKNFAGHPIPRIYQGGDGRQGYEYIGHDCPMADLASSLTSAMGTNVVDSTGLTGTYDFLLQYSQASDERREADPSIWPPVPDALSKDLGLQLQTAKGPVKLLLVDHVEPPTPN